MERILDLFTELEHQSSDELMQFWKMHQKGRGAKQLFPTGGKNTRRMTSDLANYAANLATSKRTRLNGDIPTAMMYEKIAESIIAPYENKARKERTQAVSSVLSLRKNPRPRVSLSGRRQKLSRAARVYLGRDKARIRLKRIDPRKRKKLLRQIGFRVNPAKRTYWTVSNTKLEHWNERDRLHIGLETIDGKTIADWWDDDAQQMFEDGFFNRHRLHQSVVDYANDMGLRPVKSRKNPTLHATRRYKKHGGRMPIAPPLPETSIGAFLAKYQAVEYARAYANQKHKIVAIQKHSGLWIVREVNKKK